MNNQNAANADIREEIELSGVNKWEIAAKLGIHHSTFSVWLRMEMSDERKERVHRAICELKEAQE